MNLIKNPSVLSSFDMTNDIFLVFFCQFLKNFFFVFTHMKNGKEKKNFCSFSKCLSKKTNKDQRKIYSLNASKKFFCINFPYEFLTTLINLYPMNFPSKFFRISRESTNLLPIIFQLHFPQNICYTSNDLFFLLLTQSSNVYVPLEKKGKVSMNC